MMAMIPGSEGVQGSWEKGQAQPEAKLPACRPCWAERMRDERWNGREEDATMQTVMGDRARRRTRVQFTRNDVALEILRIRSMPSGLADARSTRTGHSVDVCCVLIKFRMGTSLQTAGRQCYRRDRASSGC